MFCSNDGLTPSLQVKLLNSISDNFHQAMKSSQGKLEFSQQFDAIVRGVEESLRKQLTVLAGKDQMVEESKGIYQRVSHFLLALALHSSHALITPSHQHILSSSHALITCSHHMQLVDEQRKYFKTVKDFQDECNKNDWLVAKREQLLAKTSS